MAARLVQAEQELFAELGIEEGSQEVPALFVLGAPRTGSTLLYQVLINTFSFSYITNYTNDLFPETPALGAAIEAALGVDPQVTYASSYGKTRGCWEPSEGSAVFRNWYGGAHPSQVLSAWVRPEKAKHMDRTLRAIWWLRRRPFLAKNAWNCFRIRDLASRYPRAAFVWIRRDVVAAAASDLEARERRGSKNHWNSATPANVAVLRDRPHWQQVAEQQFEYHLAIQDGLERWARDRWIDLWYENLCDQPAREVGRLREFLPTKLPGCVARNGALHGIAMGASRVGAEDLLRIRSYVEGEGRARFVPLRCMGSQEVDVGDAPQ